MFTKGGDAVIAGGTNGGARVLDSRTSETIQLLPHDGTSLSISVPFDNTHICVQVISYRPLSVFVHT